jgi:hypothetical protein
MGACTGYSDYSREPSRRLIGGHLRNTAHVGVVV